MLSRLYIAILACVVSLLSITQADAQYNKEYFLWQSRRQLTADDPHGAITTLNTLLRVDNRASEGYFMRAIAKYNLGDLIGADYDFTLAIDCNPVYTMAYNYRAITRSRLGNYDDALRDFAEAVSLRPDIPDAYYSRGVTRLLNQQFSEALEDFNRFIIYEKRVADAYVNRGICYLQLRDTMRAYDSFTTAIVTNRNSPEGYSRRGTLFMQQDSLHRAEGDFSRAIQNDSTHIISLFNRALVYNDLNRPYDSLRDLDRVIEIDPNNSITHFNRAIILSRIGDYNRAVADYDRVVDLSPNNVLVYFYRANLLSRLGEVESAERDYTKAIELYPDFANAYLYRSNIRTLLRDSKGAMRDKETAERKIAEHKSKLRDSTYSIYSDSTYQFDRLLSFDTKLAGSNFEHEDGDLALGRRGSDLQLLPLFKFTFIQRDSLKIEHREYYDIPFERFMERIGEADFTIDRRTTNIPSDSLAAMERRYAISSVVDGDWRTLFKLGITQSLIKQYTTSLENLSAAIALNDKIPFLYINRSATRAEMIEFISSIESSFQRISIDSGASAGLKGTPQQRRVYNYDEAMEDLDRAIELHPDFAYSHYNRAALLVLSGRLPEAYEAYSRAIELYGGLAEAYYNRGVVQIMMKDTRKGCIDLSKAGELGIDGAYKLLEKYSRQ